MKFIDEANIMVTAGKGGHGCLSFRREKYVPRGGPDGGDGGQGGNIYLIGEEGLNTLGKFRYNRIFKAANGQPGMGRERSGKSADDLYIPVPLGTEVFDSETKECIGDITTEAQTLLVAKGGTRGLGNIHFKSSTNQTPRKTTQGKLGESRELHLQLKVLADVGLVGMPNAGKSTFIRSVSAARPKVADYPFTTLTPNLGVVSLDCDSNFVIADIPGLIPGAAEGAGLGIRFLKHLSRTELLFHIVDINPIDNEQAPIDAIRAIEKELTAFDEGLASKPRWLVFNKVDTLQTAESDRIIAETLKALDWQSPVFSICALKASTTQEICQKAQQFLSSERQ